MASYGQFCPVSKAMELLDERWTILVVRELLVGSTHFNDLRRGNPRMSPALLSKRLRTLERAGVLVREVEGRRTRYVLTAAGEELRPAVEALAAWGTRWVGELGDEDLDPHLLMWDLRRTVRADAWPPGRTVVAFHLTEVPADVARWWFCVDAGDVDVCDFDPGFEVTATLSASLRTLVEVWRGDRSWQDATDLDLVRVAGASPVARRLPQLLGQMPTAAVPRPG